MKNHTVKYELEGKNKTRTKKLFKPQRQSYILVTLLRLNHQSEKERSKAISFNAIHLINSEEGYVKILENIRGIM